MLIVFAIMRNCFEIPLAIEEFSFDVKSFFNLITMHSKNSVKVSPTFVMDIFVSPTTTVANVKPGMKIETSFKKFRLQQVIQQ